MAAAGLDTLVVRSPDNVCYLTNYWPMKGYDVAIFPLEGEPTLIVMEPQYEEAQRTAWTADVRPFPFYDPADPAAARGARAGARARAARASATAAASASSPRRARRRPTAWSASRPSSGAAGSTASTPSPPRSLDAAAAARARADDQDRAGARADARWRTRSPPLAMEHVRDNIRPGHARERGRRDVRGPRPRERHRLPRQGRAGARDHAGLGGPGDPHLHRDRQPPGARRRADAARDLGLRRRLLVGPDQERLPGHAASRVRRAARRPARRLRRRRRARAARAPASPSSTS